jgi:hypothetical protein
LKGKLSKYEYSSGANFVLALKKMELLISSKGSISNQAHAVSCSLGSLSKAVK